MLTRDLVRAIRDLRERLRLPKQADASRLWEDLAGDPRVAFVAVQALIDAPGPAVLMLKDQTKPPTAAEGDRVERLLERLDSDQFAVRQAALQELRRLGWAIEPALRQALAAKPSAQTAAALEGLLIEARQRPGAEALRSLRALRVLERVATPETAKLLEALAEGSPAFAITHDARDSLTRLRK